MTKNDITLNSVLTRLQQRVTFTNARLLLETAKVQTGILNAPEQALEEEQARALCMKLISLGGPSFHVGQAIYKECFM